jgi:phosphoribosylanthranilate isomerase
MTKIKFCGLRRPTDAAHAEKLGATYGGVIFAESPRRVTIEEARAVFDAAPLLKRVGVMGYESIAQLIEIARKVDLHVLQLHGNFTSDDHAQLRQEFDGELWSVIPVDSSTGAIASDWRDVADAADAILLDTIIGSKTGGTGKVFNWEAARDLVNEISRELPVVLAGGLSPGNVASAIAELRPAVVDVSSGVETSPGVKSHELMSAFAQAVVSASIV